MSDTEHHDDLEAECRKARTKGKNVCVWDLRYAFWTAGCTGLKTLWFDYNYTFCPYCGKKIEG